MYKQRGDNLLTIYQQLFFQFFLFMTAQVLIHCKPQILDNEELINNSNLLIADVNEHGEVDIYVNDNDISDDEEFVSSYGIDYDLVNCIEAM